MTNTWKRHDYICIFAIYCSCRRNCAGIDNVLYNTSIEPPEFHFVDRTWNDQCVKIRNQMCLFLLDSPITTSSKSTWCSLSVVSSDIVVFHSSMHLFSHASPNFLFWFWSFLSLTRWLLPTVSLWKWLVACFWNFLSFLRLSFSVLIVVSTCCRCLSFIFIIIFFYMKD